MKWFVDAFNYIKLKCIYKQVNNLLLCSSFLWSTTLLLVSSRRKLVSSFLVAIKQSMKVIFVIFIVSRTFTATFVSLTLLFLAVKYVAVTFVFLLFNIFQANQIGEIIQILHMKKKMSVSYEYQTFHTNLHQIHSRISSSYSCLIFVFPYESRQDEHNYLLHNGPFLQ